MADDPCIKRTAFKGRSPREHRAVVEWKHPANATDSSADESLEVEETGQPIAQKPFECGGKKRARTTRDQRREGNDRGGPCHKVDPRS